MKNFRTVTPTILFAAVFVAVGTFTFHSGAQGVENKTMITVLLAVDFVPETIPLGLERGRIRTGFVRTRAYCKDPGTRLLQVETSIY